MPFGLGGGVTLY